MKKIIFIILFLLLTTKSYSAVPVFKAHELKNLVPGINYSINTPIAFDYDGDEDIDVLIMSKEGVLYFLENLTN